MDRISEVTRQIERHSAKAPRPRSGSTAPPAGSRSRARGSTCSSPRSARPRPSSGARSGSSRASDPRRLSQMRVAAVDLGTNSTRLLVADVDDGGVTEVVRRLAITRLGEGVDRTRCAAAAGDRARPRRARRLRPRGQSNSEPNASSPSRRALSATPRTARSSSRVSPRATAGRRASSPVRRRRRRPSTASRPAARSQPRPC